MRRWGAFFGILIFQAVFPLLCLADAYITAGQAIREIFPDYQEYKEELHTTQEGQKVDVFEVSKERKLIGWAAVLDEKGMKEPITFLAGISTEAKVLGVYVLEYHEPFGFEIKEKSFLGQFQGKSIGNPLTVGEDIDAVTHATISSKAAAVAVKKALKVIDDLKKNAPHA